MGEVLGALHSMAFLVWSIVLAGDFRCRWLGHGWVCCFSGTGPACSAMLVAIRSRTVLTIMPMICRNYHIWLDASYSSFFQDWICLCTREKTLSEPQLTIDTNQIGDAPDSDLLYPPFLACIFLVRGSSRETIPPLVPSIAMITFPL